jgi:hypothetical protein
MGWNCLRTTATNGPIVHPPGDMWAWRAMVMMMPAGDNYWLVHQSSLAVLPAEKSGSSRRNGWRSENFAYQYLEYLKGFLTCRKILIHGTWGFTSHPKECVLRIFIALTDPSPRPGLNPRPLGPVAITLTTMLYWVKIHLSNSVCRWYDIVCCNQQQQLRCSLAITHSRRDSFVFFFTYLREFMVAV